jgi:hypothetical protein
MKKLFMLYLHCKDVNILKLVYAESEAQVIEYAEKTFDNLKYTYKTEEVIDLTKQMHIVTSTSPSMGGYCINVSFITEYNGDTWTSQPYHLPLEAWDEHKEAELKEEFKQFVLSKS